MDDNKQAEYGSITLRDYRAALLRGCPEEKWKSRPFHFTRFVHTTFTLGDSQLSGREIVEKYKRQFPSTVRYSPKGEAYRMLNECGIPTFKFSEKETLRRLLLSRKNKEEWQKHEVQTSEFAKMRFRYAGVSITGQMLLYHLATETINERLGTDYCFGDMMRNKHLRQEIQSFNSMQGIKRAFRATSLKAKYNTLAARPGSRLLLRAALLSKGDKDKWKSYRGSAEDFNREIFDIGTFKRFSGAQLRTQYHIVGCSSLESLFAYAGLEVGTDPEIKRGEAREHYEDFLAAFGDQTELRKTLLQVCSEEEWIQPKRFKDMRKKRVVFAGRPLTLHTLMQEYGAYKHNIERINGTESPRTFGALQDETTQSPAVTQSNKQTLIEMLNGIGIDASNAFIPEITDLDLLDKEVIQRLLSNATIENMPVTLDEMLAMRTTDFRRVRFRDPVSGAEMSGQTLMLYETGQMYTMKNPKVDIDEAVFTLKQGKSNKQVQERLITTARP